MKIEILETILVVIIVAIQVWVFTRTFIQIGVFRRIIPEILSLEISKVKVPVTDIEKLSPKEILANIARYRYQESINSTGNDSSDSDYENETSPYLFDDFHKHNKTDSEVISFLESAEKANHVFDKILFSINNYLIRNRGAASDFNLIKDIVERNTSAVEEDINISIAIPLYLGLMGTMLGVVIGLFNIPDLSIVLGSKESNDILNEGISSLIGGVKIAMIASFSGLLLTIINSGWVFKGSRSLIEARKNDFYTFIQIELLPIINQGLASTLESLQRNLLKFNNEFTTNLRQLTGIFDSNTRTIKAQKELLDAIDKSKISEMTRYNVKVMQQLDISVSQFEKFNKYFTNVNLFVENSQHIVNRTNELLARTDNFKVIATNIDSRLNQSQMLLEFVSEHFKNLEAHKVFTSNAVADVGFSISETFKELKVHIQNSSEQVKIFTVGELEALKNALSESKTNLSNLEHLATLNKDLSHFKNSSASQGERIKQQLDELNKNMVRSITILEANGNGKPKGITSRFKNIFHKKEK